MAVSCIMQPYIALAYCHFKEGTLSVYGFLMRKTPPVSPETFWILPA